MEGSWENGSERTTFRGRISWLLREFDFRKDKRAALFLLEGAGVLLLISELFYSSLLAALFLAPLLIPIYLRRKRIRDENRRKELVQEFRECMNSVLTALKAGYSAENAFRESAGEMEYLFGKRSEICRELNLIAGGLDSSVPLEKLLLDFGKRSGTSEIRDFAEIFSIAKRNGGRMTEIMTKTIHQIEDRIEVEKEINVLISSRKLEQHIMDAVPFVIILYISMTSEGFFDVLYHNPAGIVIMSGCLLVYFAAFVISEKIVSIHV